MKTLDELMPEIIRQIEDNGRTNESWNFQMTDDGHYMDVFADCDENVKYTPATHYDPDEVSGYWMARIRADWFDRNGDLVKSEEITEKIEL